MLKHLLSQAPLLFDWGEMEDLEQLQQHVQQQQPPQQQQLDSNQLLEYIRHLEVQIQELHLAQAPPPLTPQAPNPNAGLRPTKPPNFGGKLNESVDAWIFIVK